MAMQLIKHTSKRRSECAPLAFGRNTHRAPPTGRVLKVSTTAKVIELLADNPTRWYRLSVIAKSTRSNPKTVSWALDQLKQLDMVETCGIGDPKQCPRYLRYRWKSL
jgi:hypothetical protein